MAAEIAGEDLTAGLGALRVRHFGKPIGVVDLGGAFDDKGSGVVIELISMSPDPAEIGLFENNLNVCTFMKDVRCRYVVYG